MTKQKAHLVLADGTVFEGYAIGAPGSTVGEAVFTTGMTGYQEVLTDPSLAGQIVCMTAPEVGNVGTTPEDDEGPRPFLAGFVIHSLSPIASNWRSKQSLGEYLAERGVVGIAGVDTRALTRHLRDHGVMMAALGAAPVEELKERAASAPSLSSRDLTAEVSTREAYAWTEGTSDLWRASDMVGEGLHVVAIDYGTKRNILRCFVDLGCRVTVMPASASAEEVLAQSPDGVFLSNGPGDPAAVEQGIETVRSLLGQKPLFGVCLGHQLLALALGAKTFKLKFGHRGLNHPVKDLATGRIRITAQNHGFAVDHESLPADVALTHVHLNDGTCQGIEHRPTGAFGVQFHPEASAGPHDARDLFRRFVDRMRA